VRSLKVIYTVLLGFAFLSIGCGSGDRVIATKRSGPMLADSIQDEIDNREMRTFMDGKKAQLLSDIPQAVNMYTECVRINPLNAAAKYELSKIYANNQKNEAALAFAKDAANLDLNNKWYQLNYADILSANKNYKEAATVYETLQKRNPDEQSYYINAAVLYLKAGKATDAIRLFNNLEKRVGVNEDLVQQKVQLYSRMGKVAEAIIEVEKLIALNPQEPRNYGLLAELYENNHQPEKALQTYERLSVASPNSGLAELSMAQFYFNKKDQVNYIKYLHRSLQNPELTVDMKIAILTPLLQQSLIDSAALSLSAAAVAIFVQAHPTDARVLAISGDIFGEQKNYQQAEIAYCKSLQIDAKEFGVWLQVFFVLSDTRKYDSLLVFTERARALFPEQVMVHFFNGIANLQLKKYTESVKSLKKAAVMTGDNVPLEAQTYASLGEAYHSLKRYGASDSCYEKALLLKSDDAFVMNNYAYYLSLRQANLERAEALSKRTLELSPNNASFEDTYGWILFRLNKLEEAKKWIEKALSQENNSNNPTLLEHLGDVYANMGNEVKSLEYWNKALFNKSDSPSIAKKIAARKFLEE